MTTSLQRDTRLDGIKFVLICLVIMGHITYADFGLRSHRFIYAFHMPMFVMISGYLTHQHNLRKFIKSSLKLLALYLIFQTLHMIFSLLVLDKPFVLSKYFDPAIALWYILSLFFWRCAYALFRPLKIKLPYVFILSIILAIVSGFIPLGNDCVAFQRTFAFLPFFVFGLMLKDVKLQEWIAGLNNILVGVLVFIALVCAYNTDGYMPSSPYEAPAEALTRLLQSVVAFVLCIGIWEFCPRKMPALFSSLGQITLYYYLYHTLMIKAMLKVFKDYQYVPNVFEALLMLVAMVLLITLMHKLKPFRWLLLDR